VCVCVCVCVSLSTGNQIGDEGAATLAEALKHNTSLTTLDLRGNRIGDEGAAMLAEAVQHNTSLTTLNLAGNRIGDEGAATLAKALEEHNITLSKLEIEGYLLARIRPLDERKKCALKKFRETLAASGELLQLIGYDVRNGDPNLMQELFSYLQKNTMELSNVRLNHFQLTTAQWTHLSNALGTLSNLSSLDLAGVGEDGVQAIAAMLNTNSSLQHLTITAWEPAHMWPAGWKEMTSRKGSCQQR